MLFSRRLFLASASSAGFVGSCGGGGPPPPPPPPSPAPPGPVTFAFNFANGLAGWEPAYADYALGQEPDIAFAFGHERLPAPLDQRSGFYMESHNRSDDVFMYAVRLVDGLAASTRYRVGINLTIATNAPPGCVGIGGAPGESVAVKAGAVPFRPANQVENGMVRVDFDKGNQSQGGMHAVVIGDLAQDAAGDCLQPDYRQKTLTTGGNGPTVTSDSSGRLWLVIGTDSGFEGLTRVYFLEGAATFTPA